MNNFTSRRSFRRLLVATAATISLGVTGLVATADEASQFAPGVSIDSGFVDPGMNASFRLLEGPDNRIVFVSKKGVGVYKDTDLSTVFTQPDAITNPEADAEVAGDFLFYVTGSKKVNKIDLTTDVAPDAEPFFETESSIVGIAATQDNAKLGLITVNAKGEGTFYLVDTASGEAKEFTLPPRSEVYAGGDTSQDNERLLSPWGLADRSGYTDNLAALPDGTFIWLNESTKEKGFESRDSQLPVHINPADESVKVFTATQEQLGSFRRPNEAHTVTVQGNNVVFYNFLGTILPGTDYESDVESVGTYRYSDGELTKLAVKQVDEVDRLIGATFTPDGKQLVLADSSGTVAFLNTDTLATESSAQLLPTAEDGRRYDNQRHRLAFAKGDGNYYAVVGHTQGESQPTQLWIAEVKNTHMTNTSTPPSQTPGSTPSTSDPTPEPRHDDNNGESFTNSPFFPLVMVLTAIAGIVGVMAAGLIPGIPGVGAAHSFSH